MSNMLRVMQELEDAPDDFLRKIIEEGDERYPPWAATLVANQRADMRERFTARDTAHQAEQPTISQREADRLGGGIPTVDTAMPLEDPQLQQGIATASGGLIPGYHEGGEVGHEHDPATGRHIDPDTGRPIIEPQEGALSGMNLSGVGIFPDQKQNLPSRIIQAIPPTLGAMGSTDVYDIETGEARPMSERRAEYQARKDRLREIEEAQAEVEAEVDDGTITTESGRRYTPEEIEEATYEKTNIRQLNDMLRNREITLDQFNQAKQSLIDSGALGAEAEGAPDDWLRALMEGDQSFQQGMYATGRKDIQDVEDAILNRTELDEAHNLLREREADLLEQQLGDKGIRGLAERDRLQEFAESRQELSGKSAQDYRDLREWDRERIGNLAEGTGMLVGLGPEDDYLKNIHEALGDISADSTLMEHTALSDIISQLEEGKTWEKEDFGEVYTQSEAAQKDIDKARSDRLGFDVTRADEEANRERLTKERLLKDRLGLVERGMQEEGANERALLAAQNSRRTAEITAKTNLKSLTSDPGAYLILEQIAADVIDATDDPSQQEMMRDALQRIGVGMVSAADLNIAGTMTPESASVQRTQGQGITSRAQAEAVAQFLQQRLGDIPPELLAQIMTSSVGG